ncbi:MAG: Uma2 family endonuclease [Planctomycetes bacterium]|nr:Uma2 family endonuclease [Planctomycetota bacterium]
MSILPSPRLTPEQYLEIERGCEQKHQFYRGEMFAMSGASIAHNLVTFNLAGVLHAQLKDRDCQAFVNDMRVHIPSTGLYTYPDGIITCEKPRFQDDHFDTLLNPQVIIEVLSPSTENYDRSKKFKQYREIDSLQDYVLIAQDSAIIERFSHDEHGNWFMVDAQELGATMELPAVDCKLPLADIYAKVEFPEVTKEDLAKAGLFSE